MDALVDVACPAENKLKDDGRHRRDALAADAAGRVVVSKEASKRGVVDAARVDGELRPDQLREIQRAET